MTDPPYNLNKIMEQVKINWNLEEYLEFSRTWLNEAKRVLKPDGTIYVFMGMKYISYIYTILEQELGMTFNSWITWFLYTRNRKTKGFSPRHDDILMFTKNPKSFSLTLDSIRVPQKYYRSVNNMHGANPEMCGIFLHMHYCNKNRKNIQLSKLRDYMKE